MHHIKLQYLWHFSYTFSKHCPIVIIRQERYLKIRQSKAVFPQWLSSQSQSVIIAPQFVLHVDLGL